MSWLDNFVKVVRVVVSIMGVFLFFSGAVKLMYFDIGDGLLLIGFGMLCVGVMNMDYSSNPKRNGVLE